MEDSIGEYKYNYIPLVTTSDQVDCSVDFAEKNYILRKDNYAKRGQHDKNIIIQQISSGKIFEWAVFNYCQRCYPSQYIISKPSVEIFKSPTYDPDITVVDPKSGGRANIHIKSQSISRVGEMPPSWAFQRSDPLFRSHKKDLIFVGFYISNIESRLLGMGTAESYERFMGPPKVASLASKRFLYYKYGEKEFV